MKYQEWLNGCGCCPDIQDCPPSTGNPCDCDSILLELSKQHTDDLVLQDEIDNLDEKKLDASAYTPDEYATEEWVNEQGFLKTVEPLKTINGESLIGEGDIVISGGSGDAYTKAETDALLDEKVNVVDNEVPDYNVTNEIAYQGGYPSQSETASTWDDASMFTLRYNFIRISDANFTTTAAVIDPSGNITTGSVTISETGIANPLPDYIDMSYSSDDNAYRFTAKEGYRIAHLDIYNDKWATWGYIREERVETVFEGGQSADVIKDVIEPILINKQDKLVAGENITISGNVISSTSGGGGDAYTKAETDAKFATITNFNSHSGNTNLHVTAAEKNSWNEKADASNVYTKTEVDNKVSVKPNVWCGDSQAWSQISGSTQQNTLYLVY